MSSAGAGGVLLITDSDFCSGAFFGGGALGLKLDGRDGASFSGRVALGTGCLAWFTRSRLICYSVYSFMSRVSCSKSTSHLWSMDFGSGTAVSAPEALRFEDNGRFGTRFVPIALVLVSLGARSFPAAVLRSGVIGAAPVPGRCFSSAFPETLFLLFRSLRSMKTAGE